MKTQGGGLKTFSPTLFKDILFHLAALDPVVQGAHKLCATVARVHCYSKPSVPFI